MESCSVDTAGGDAGELDANEEDPDLAAVVRLVAEMRDRGAEVELEAEKLAMMIVRACGPELWRRVRYSVRGMLRGAQACLPSDASFIFS